MSENTVTLFAVGDLILKNEDPESYFDLVTPTLKAGDIVIGQGELSYTNRPARTTETISAEDPESMKGLTYAGFNVITLTGNHMWDAGVPGIEDKRLYNFEPDPENPDYPFHPDSKQTIIAKCLIENGSIRKVSYLPCLINKTGQPEILKHDERGEMIFNYMKKITEVAEIKASFEWDGDEVLVHE